jgi:mannose/fructose/N-acetylgalactosamine-specific phosphotransferase system component IIB
MPRIIYRVDYRLVHGQVIEGWVHNLGLTRIIIVSDKVKNDSMYLNMLKFSVPEEIKVDVFGISEMYEKARIGYIQHEDTIVLFENPRDVISLIDYGVEISSLNVGCMHYDGKNRQVRKNIAVSEENIKDFMDINAMGTKIESRSLPQDKEVNLVELLKGME